jgi:hypothetical protein
MLADPERVACRSCMQYCMRGSGHVVDKAIATFHDLKKQMLQLKNRVEAQRQARAKLLKAVEGESHKEEVMRKDEVHKEDKKALKTSRSEEAKMDYVLKDGAKAEEQVKAVLEAGAKAEEQVTSESDYQSTVQAAMEADLRRRARERKMREEFRAKRAERLFQDDSSNTAKIEASMDKVANAVMQPGQLVNAARARQSDGTVCLVPGPAVSASWRCACTFVVCLSPRSLPAAQEH